MHKEYIESVLRAVARNEKTVAEALADLSAFPIDELGFAQLDTHRGLRTGYGEVVYCQGKTPDQTATICSRLATTGGPVLATRADAETFRAVKAALPEAHYYEMARIIVIGEAPDTQGTIAVVSAGTADLPMAEEAAVTAAAVGTTVERIYDIGVAGIHRLLNALPRIRGADAVVAVAGMEGALPGIVAGLTGGPVIGVPTSVGYGVHLSGLATLLTMLNSCAAGLAVVNIDNGFGAGYLAARIARRRHER